jgi:hypothetical protein
MILVSNDRTYISEEVEDMRSYAIPQVAVVNNPRNKK